MSVDANSFVGYGILVDGSLFHYEDYENGDKMFSWSTDEDSYGLNYNYEMTDKIDGYIRVEPYDSDWTFIGIKFLSKDVDKTIGNLKTVKERFDKMYKELMDTIPETEVSLRETLNKEKPEIIEMAYYS